MKNHSESQLELLNDQSTHHTSTPQASPRLVIELEQRSWLRFLSEEWLLPEVSGGILLGVGNPCDRNILSDSIAVAVCFDFEKLPDSDVMVWRDDSWINVSLNSLKDTDKAVIWNGPLPLFAVEVFRVASHENRAHLLAQVRLFADMELPQQPIEVVTSQKTELTVPIRKKFPFGQKNAPANWDSLRGAAAMAIECVPTIGPWLQVLCDLFSKSHSTVSSNVVAAPWLAFAPWASSFEDTPNKPALWTAIIEVFSDVDIMSNWRPDLILRSVCDKARNLGGNADRLLYLEESTEKLLKDLGDMQDLGIKDNELELALQLVLLRHTPERFVTWKKSRPSIAPSAWWTGAILAGYLCGYKALPISMRGRAEARKFLALRTWRLVDEKSSHDWNASNKSDLSWALENESFCVKQESALIVSHKVSNRGRWYELNSQSSFFREQAEKIALQFCPELIKQTLILDEGSYAISGKNLEGINCDNGYLKVPGRIEIAVGEKAQLQSRLDVHAFRTWLATASLRSPIPNPLSIACDSVPGSNTLEDSLTPSNTTKQTIQIRKKTSEYIDPNLDNTPSGFRLINNFITSKEESSLLAAIDNSEWDSSMDRRVQHYGWKYDYKSRKISTSAYLGPLPDWAEKLASKLIKLGYLSIQPDQVIVNEYLGSQGISKHIDCKSCFKGAVVTISLLESWEMIFSRKSKGLNERYKIVLARRSAAVLDGESRTDWFHEIPRRIKELDTRRERRISITFRKVAETA